MKVKVPFRIKQQPCGDKTYWDLMGLRGSIYRLEDFGIVWVWARSGKRFSQQWAAPAKEGEPDEASQNRVR